MVFCNFFFLIILNHTGMAKLFLVCLSAPNGSMTEYTVPPSSIALLNQCMSISKGSFSSVIINNGIKYMAFYFVHDLKNILSFFDYSSSV